MGPERRLDATAKLDPDPDAAGPELRQGRERTPPHHGTALRVRPPTPPRVRRAGTKPLDADWLDEVTRLLDARLPLSERDLGVLLMAEGVSPEPVTFGHLARLYRLNGAKLPFGIVSCNGMTIGISAATYSQSSKVVTTALQMMQYWGMARVDAVARRAEVLAARPVDPALARRVLQALPGLLWLDGNAREWFSFPDQQGGIASALLKVFAVAPRVKLSELRSGLAKALPGLDDVPDRALERYLGDVAACVMDGPFVQRRAGVTPPSVLTTGETTLLRLLDAAGGELGLEELRAQTRSTTLPRSTVSRLLRLSPLFLVTPDDRVRLIGNRTRKDEPPEIAAPPA